MKVAQEDPVLVSIEGDSEVLTKRNVAGMYLITGSDLKAFVEAVRKTQPQPAKEDK